MGKMEVAPLSRPPREPREFPWNRAMMAVAIALLLWIGFKQATKPKEKEPEKGWILPLLEPPKPQVVYVVEKQRAAPAVPKPDSAADPLASADPPPPAPPAVIHEASQELPAASRVAVTPPPPTISTEYERETAAMVRCFKFEVIDDAMEEWERRKYRDRKVRVKAENMCRMEFPGPDLWVEVRALPTAEKGVSARVRGNFQGPIQPFSKTEALMVLDCDPNRHYDFVAAVNR